VNGDAVSWLRRYAFKGKSPCSRLGSYPQLSLAGVRAKRKDERTKIRAGVDRVAERKVQRTAAERPKETFHDVAKDFVTNHESQWTNPKHRDQWTATLERYCYAYPIIWDMAVDEITTENARSASDLVHKIRDSASRVRVVRVSPSR
jgi:Arm DNA-binding domain